MCIYADLYDMSWIRQRDFVSDDGLTAASSLRHVCLTRHACAVFGAEQDLVVLNSLFLVVGRRRSRSDHEEIHGGKPFSGPTQPTLSWQDP